MIRTRPPSARGATRWLIAGAVAGLLLIACMFALRVVFGAPTPPELVEDLVIAGGALARLLEIRLVQQGAPETTEVRTGAAQTTETSAAEPAEPLTMPAGVAAEVTPNDRFYIVSKNFNDPRVSADKWSLQSSGWWRSPRGSHMRRSWRYRE